ncbi:organic solute transporter subunit alpha [Paralichthys olivaceus]|uniref:organic solute transporter subunit alpha n=1 Tax=Paralichthys olivaceus TaxID=8255 RepID=UPI00097D95FA|nr:PREDICTED: organic solute transporter subunit alpha-like [Paralichthys olivaceus]
MITFHENFQDASFGHLERRGESAAQTLRTSVDTRGTSGTSCCCLWREIRRHHPAMNNGSNRTIDPSCRGKPPFAIDIIVNLDIFGKILYSILTFMAVLSMLLFIEECIYIYKKVPSNKKSVMIWVNGAAPVIATMSCVGMWVPRATMFTDMTSACYFAIVVFKFLILMLEEVGGDKAFLMRAGKHKLKISTGPCCCCCLCLPHVAITGRSLFLLKLGSFQFALMKTVFTILSIVLWTNGTFELTDLNITGAAIWINPFVGILTIIALWPVAIIFMHLRTALRTIKIIPKYAMYQLVLILSQLQSAIINILAMNGTITCIPPFSAPARGYMISQQLLILEMFIITLVTRLLYRRQYEPLPEEKEDDNNENTKMVVVAESA